MDAKMMKRSLMTASASPAPSASASISRHSERSEESPALHPSMSRIGGDPSPAAQDDGNRRRALLLAAVLLSFFAVVVLVGPQLARADADVEGAWVDSEHGVEFGYTVSSGEATITKIAKAEGNEDATYEAYVPESISLSPEDGGGTYLVTAIADDVMGQKLTGGLTAPTTTEDTELVKLVLPSRLLTIGEKAFMGCKALEALEMPRDNLQSVGDYAFYRSGIDKVVLPDTVTSIGFRAFSHCERVDEIRLPASHATIDDTAFDGTVNMTKLVIPDGCVNMPPFKIYKVEELDIPASVLSAVNVAQALNVSSNALATVKLPAEAGFTSLSLALGDADLYVGGQKEWRIPEGVTRLALSGSFDSLQLPSTLRTIAQVASKSLASITVPANVTTLAMSCFINDTALEHVAFEEGSDGSSVIEIGKSAFAGCTALSGITLPSRMVTLDNSAFAGCTALESIVIPSSVQAVGVLAFSGCTALKSIVFQDGAVSSTVARHASVNRLAEGCTSLEEVVLPSSLVELTSASSYFAFSDCPALSRVYTRNPDMTIRSGDFVDCGDFTVYGWGADGAVVDYAELSGHVFVPYAELDDTGWNKAANAVVTATSEHAVEVACSYVMPTTSDVKWAPRVGEDCTLAAYGDYLVVTGNGKTCFGTARVPAKVSIARAEVADIPAQVTDGTPVKPRPAVTWDGSRLVEGRDYTCAYADNDRAGTGTVVLSGVGNFSGEKSVTFAISERHELSAVPALSRMDTALVAVTGVRAPATCDAVVVAWAFDAADVALGSALAASMDAQLLCVSNAGGLTAAQMAQLSAWGPSRAYAVGGAARCGQGATGDVRAKVGECVELIGADAAARSIAVLGASDAWGNVAVVCNPAEPAVCVSAAAYAGAVGAPLVLTRPDGVLDAGALARLASFSQVVVVGDWMAVDASIDAALASASPAPSVVRLAGSTPVQLSAAIAAHARATGAYSGDDVTFAMAPENASSNAAQSLVAARARGVFQVE